MKLLDKLFPKKPPPKQQVDLRLDHCPHCQIKLDPIPTRKKKCPSCGHHIYVRTHPESRQKLLVTEAGAKQIDDMWAERARVQAVQKRAEINRQLHQAMQNGDLGAMSRCYHGLAIDNAEQGLPYFGLLKEAAKFELLSLKQSGVVSKVKISTTDSACKNCKKQNGKEYTIEQALLEMPLPNQSCTTDFADEKEGWCRCMYIAIVDEL